MPPHASEPPPPGRFYTLVHGYLAAGERDGEFLPGTADEVTRFVLARDREGRPPAGPAGRLLRRALELVAGDPARYVDPGYAPAAAPARAAVKRLKAMGVVADAKAVEVAAGPGFANLPPPLAVHRCLDLLDEPGHADLRAERPAPSLFAVKARRVLDLLADHLRPGVDLDALAARWSGEVGRVPVRVGLQIAASRLRSTYYADLCRDGVPASIQGFELAELASRAEAEDAADPRWQEVREKLLGQF
jgi:hypothetical protein